MFKALTAMLANPTLGLHQLQATGSCLEGVEMRVRLLPPVNAQRSAA